MALPLFSLAPSDGPKPLSSTQSSSAHSGDGLRESLGLCIGDGVEQDGGTLHGTTPLVVGDGGHGVGSGDGRKSPPNGFSMSDSNVVPWFERKSISGRCEGCPYPENQHVIKARVRTWGWHHGCRVLEVWPSDSHKFMKCKCGDDISLLTLDVDDAEDSADDAEFGRRVDPSHDSEGLDHMQPPSKRQRHKTSPEPYLAFGDIQRPAVPDGRSESGPRCEAALE